MRQIALDTETTGLSTKNGDRIIEIGCVEIIDRVITGKVFHSYCDPGCSVGKHTLEITGINDEFLLDKPKFSHIAGDFLDFIQGAELIIHNAPFDLEFINYELKLSNHQIQKIEDICTIVDTLVLARTMHPGQRNNLDALSKRYNVNLARQFHGALLDANILARVVLKMTAGQIDFNFSAFNDLNVAKAAGTCRIANTAASNLDLYDNLKVIYANIAEVELHEKYLTEFNKT